MRQSGTEIRTWTPKPQAATIIVAASNSLHPERADYICPGANDQVTIQAAIDALPSSGADMYFMEGDYNPTSSINGKSNITLHLGQATFNWTTESALFLFTGTSSDKTTLAVDAVIMDATITVADATGLSDGDYILIYSNHLSGPGSIKDGEIHQIKSIAGNVVTLVGEIWESYGYAQVDTATVGLIDPVKNVRIEGGKIEGNSFDTGHITAITFLYGVNITLENISTSKIPSAAITLYSTINSTIKGLHIYGSAKAGVGYGISLANACSGILTEGNHIRYCRHATTSGGSATYPGTPKNCVFCNNTIYDTTGSAVDCHEYGDNFVYTSNIVSAPAGAFDIGCKRFVIQNNSILNGSISCRGNYVEEAIVLNNVLHNGTVVINSAALTKAVIIGNNTQGSSYGAAVVNADIVHVSNNTFDNTSGRGIYIVTADEAYIFNNVGRNIDAGGIDIKSVDRCIIHGNIIENPSRVGWGAGIMIDTGCGAVDIEHNKIHGANANVGIYIQSDCSAPTVRWNTVDVSGATWLSDLTGIALYFTSYFDFLMDVLAVSATHVRSNEDLSEAIPNTFTITAQPDVPRTLSGHFDTHANITAYTIDIVGVDAKGNTVTETKTEADGWDWETSNAFATITSIIMSARTGTGATDTMDIGITDVLGLSNVIYETGDVFKIKKNTANETVAGAQVNTTYGTYDMSVITLGVGDDFTIWYKSNLNIIS